MDLTQINKLTVGEIVANDFRASSIFKNAGIDFCCGGKQSLEEACMEKDVSKEDLTSQLEDLQKEPQSNSHNFKEWEPGFFM